MFKEGVRDILEKLDSDLVGLIPVKLRVRQIAALLVLDKVRYQIDRLCTPYRAAVDPPHQCGSLSKQRTTQRGPAPNECCRRVRLFFSCSGQLEDTSAV